MPAMVTDVVIGAASGMGAAVAPLPGDGRPRLVQTAEPSCPRALAAARPALMRSEIMRRSLAANAA